MVTPDYNKITPVRKDSSVQSSEDAERKPPSGDFEKVAKEVDDRDKGGGDNDFSKKDKKKVPAGTGQTVSSLNDDETPLLSPFQLARGQRDNSDEQKESHKDGAVIADSPKVSYRDINYADVDPIEAPKPKKVEGQFIPQDNPTIVPQQAPLIVPIETKLTDTKTTSPRYSVEQPDLAEFNTLGNKQAPAFVPPVFAIDASMTVDSGAAVKTPQPLQSIQVVIDQIVEKVYTLKQSGDTQVVVDLKGSFAGSRLTVTESDSAKGQLNITIDNLTGPNQALVEAHKAKIMDTLLESGVQVHRFIASTTLESSRIDVATDDTRDRGDGQDNNPQEDNPRDGRRQKSNDKT